MLEHPKGSLNSTSWRSSLSPYVCQSVYVFLYLFMYVCVCVYTRARALVRVCLLFLSHIFMYVQVHMCMGADTHVCLYMWEFMGVTSQLPSPLLLETGYYFTGLELTQ